MVVASERCLNCGLPLRLRKRSGQESAPKHVFCPSCLRAEDMEIERGLPYPGNASGEAYKVILGYGSGESEAEEGDDGDGD